MLGRLTDVISSKSTIRVRYAETDKMGVAYHGNYLTWFEVARVELFDKLGGAYSEFETEGYFMPVLSAYTKFRKPAFFDDRLSVHITMKKRPLARMTFEYEIKREGSDVLIATGETSHGFMNREGVGIRPPERFTDLIASAWADEHAD